MDELVKKTMEALERRGFHVAYAEKAEQARDMALQMIAPGESVGIGGSMTIRELGLAERLQESGHEVYWHWLAAPAERAAVQEKARKADVYLASSNALTRDGRLVNIDGNGNRTAAMYQGPKRVILIVGQQKLVDGGLNTAIARIKQHACPANAKRLKLNTPCAHTGVCNPMECGDDCMCRIVTMMEHPVHGREVTVILVEEAIGY